MKNTLKVVVDVENTAEHSDDIDDGGDTNDEGSCRRRSKKSKVASKFQLDSEVSKLIKLDEQNNKLWDDVLSFVEQGQQVILIPR